jgi:hypothetical protein
VAGDLKQALLLGSTLVVEFELLWVWSSRASNAFKHLRFAGDKRWGLVA